MLFLSLAPGPVQGNVRIDAAKTLGPVPEVLSSSIWLHHLGNDDLYTLGKFLSENRPRTVHLSLTVLQESKSFDDYKSMLGTYLDADGPALLIRKAQEQGFRIIIGFDPCPMPAWLSSRPGDMRPASNWGYSIQTCSPPSDLRRWGDVARHTMQSFRERGVKNLGLYIGHEQEREWIGDERSFFKYYEYAARAVKDLDRTIAVGGPGPSGWMEKRHDCAGYPSAVKDICMKQGGWSDPAGEPFIKNFIDYVAAGGGGAGPVPLDFINWHNFGINTEDVRTAAATIKGWLRQAGLEGVVLFPSDWSSWSWPPYPADYIDTSEFAASIPQTLYAMWRAGIQWHGHDFNVFSSGLEKSILGARTGATFIGDWALFTRHGASGGGIIKPAYNAFRLLSLMAGGPNERNMLQADFAEQESVSVLSAAEGSAVYILLSNYVPTDSRFENYYVMKVLMFLRASGMEEEKKWLESMVKVYRSKKAFPPQDSPRKQELLDYLVKASKCANDRNPHGCEQTAARDMKDPRNLRIREGVGPIVNAKMPKDITIEIDNVRANGQAALVSYAVDDSSANACAYNKRTEPRDSGAPCGVGGAIDREIQDSLAVGSAKGKESARNELVQRFGPAEARSIETAAQNCRDRGVSMRDCLARSSTGGREEGIKAAFKQYTRAWGAEYYRRIDALNSLPEVSVEGTRKREMISVLNGKAVINVRMKPNSLMLLMLGEDPGRDHAR